MAFNTIMKDLHHILVHNGYVPKDAMVNLVRVAGLGVLVGASFLGYRWYSVGRAQAAQKRLSEVIEKYTQEMGKVQASNKKDSQVGEVAVQTVGQDWPAIASLFGMAAKEYADTSLAPFFLAYQSEALLKEGNLVDAYQILSQALAAMPRSSDLYAVYELKKVLMSLDLAILNNSSTDLAEHELLELAKDTTNKQRDMALFYAGRFYWSKGDVVRAKELLQELITLSYVDKSAASPWASKAEALVKQMGA